MTLLKLYLFGPPRLEQAGHPLAVSRRKSLALLAYLAVTNRSQHRDALATLLWPDVPQRRARGNLRALLTDLNKALDKDRLLVEGEQIALARNDDRWLDVARFQTCLEQAQRHDHPPDQLCPACLPLLREAADLYQADFLEGFTLRDSPEFDDWQFFQAESLRQEYALILERLVKGLSDQVDYEAAIPYARRWVALDPLHEPAQQALMQVYALAGQQAAALRQYEEYTKLLDEEFGLPPEPETATLYEAIKANRLVISVAKERARGRSQAKPTAASEALPLPRFLKEDTTPEPAPVFVARGRELSELEAALDSARDGRGQVIFVIGGAGHGKTMLMQEFARRAAASHPDLVIVTGYCAAITDVGDPYLPFREALNMLTGDVEAKWAAGLITRQQARQLWELMPLTLPALVKHAPDLINSLLSGPAIQERATLWADPDSPWLHELASLAANKQSPDVEQKRIFAEYVALLQAIAKKRPLLLIIEDLHWVDTASSALLFYLSREIGDHKILLTGTYRPEEVALGRASNPAAGYAEQHPLAGIVSELKRQHGDIWLDLGDLASTEGRHFVDAYLDTQPNQLGEPFRQALFRRTEGHPLFTVELIRAMQERGDLQQDEHGRWVEGEAIDWMTLPLKVEGAIERRIEALAEELQSILTAASVEGEIFTAEVLARVQQLDQRWLVQQLGRELDKRHRLVTAHAMEWLRPGRQRISMYRFRHQLFQHYLYNRLDEVERAYLHEAVGYALEQLYEGQTQEVAGQLAYHFQMAGLIPQAIDYFQQAGEAAADVYAYDEAVAHYSRALELAETEEISNEELAHLYTRLGGLLLITRGDWAPEVGQAYGKAYELYQQVGESPQLFAALRGLSMFYRMRGELAMGRRYTEELMFLAQRLEDPILIVEASFALGGLLYFAGEHGPAQKYLAQGISNYRPEQHQPLLYDQDPGVALLSYTSHNLWLLGYPDRAWQHGNEAIALAEDLAHPYSMAMALIWSCWTHIFRRETDKVLERSGEAIRLAAKHDFPLFEAIGTIQNGWALAREGQVDVGLAKMRKGLAASALAIGSESAPPTLLIHFAGVYRNYQDPDDGLCVLNKALGHGGENGLRLLEPELYRLKGELLLRRDQPNADIEATFLQAVDLARRQQVKSLELRAVMSLSRLWQAQGKTEAARKMLAEIYGWFTEGFDTLDLQEARALLQESIK